MKRLLRPTSGLDDWQALLADPQLHWKRGRSAFELAVSWEVAAKTVRGLPICVAALLDQQDDLRGASVLFAVPEHQVMLGGRGKPSQTDLWALLRGPAGLVSLAIEGKAGEPFDKKVVDWLKPPAGQSANNRHVRLQGLCSTLGVAEEDVMDLRYQLLHRAASAILEARRYAASHAVVLVQAFDGKGSGFDDFEAFGACLGCSVKRDSLVPARTLNDITLFLGWADCPVATDDAIAHAAL